MTSAPALRLTGISKRFGATQALTDAGLTIESGEVHGLVGLNGSGKSTLVKILSGYIAPDDESAACELWGAPVPLPIRAHAKLGLMFVQQDLALCSKLTVLENLNVDGSLVPAKSVLSSVRRRREKTVMADVLDGLDWDIDGDALVSDLTAGEQALVSIVRALGLAARHQDQQCLLVLDEPTAYLPPDDSERLFAAVRQLVARGNSALMISHRLDDVTQMCQGVTVLREGRVASVESIENLTKDRLADLMTGRIRRVIQPTADKPVRERSSDEPAVRVENMSAPGLHDLSFDVAAGEILGVVGLMGSGVEALSAAVIGRSPRSGQVLVAGRVVKNRVSDAVASGMAFVPEDRLGAALWGLGTITENLVVPRGRGLVSSRAMREAAQRTLAEQGIVARGSESKITELSGGNQQKVVLARALRRDDLKLLVLHEPTSGVDIDARLGIYEMLRTRARDGLAILLCSSDVDEIVRLSDRVIVLGDGRIAGELSGDEIDANEIFAMCQFSVLAGL